MSCESVTVSCDHCTFLLLVQAVWSGRLCLHYPTLENLRGGRGEGRAAEASVRPFVRSAAGCRLSIAGRPELFSSPICKIRAKKPRLHGTPLDTYTHLPRPAPPPDGDRLFHTVHDTSTYNKKSTYAQYHTTRCLDIF